MPRFSQPADISQLPKTQTLATFLSKATSKIPEFEQTAFHDPFFIAYSSGTTGTPKCIVHSIGGATLSVAKEGKLHGEMNAKSVALQYTTTGWIMYFSSVMNLLGGARVILYDGSPFQPDLKTFIRMIGEQKVTKLGTSPRWMHEMQKNGIVPKDVADLSSLKIVTSTGMVLSDQLFEWFYDVGFPSHVHLANISGGTDLVCKPKFGGHQANNCNRLAVLDRKIRYRLSTLEELKGLVLEHPLLYTTPSSKAGKAYQGQQSIMAPPENSLHQLPSPTCRSTSGTIQTEVAISQLTSRNMIMFGHTAISS